MIDMALCKKPAETVVAGDSLTALRKLVYEDKNVSMQELCKALENNYEGYGQLQKQHRDASKYGNDDDYADEQVAWVSHIFARETSRQPNTRGAFAIPLCALLQYYLFRGWVVGALPSGRPAKAGAFEYLVSFHGV